MTGTARAGIALQFAVLLLWSASASASDFQTPAIAAQALNERQAGDEPLLVIDVRSFGEYKSGHVPGAINIPHTKLERQLEKLDGANGVVLYCFDGRRTRLAEQTLIENDVANVYHLEGGVMGWRQGGFKLRTGWGP